MHASNYLNIVIDFYFFFSNLKMNLTVISNSWISSSNYPRTFSTNNQALSSWRTRVNPPRQLHRRGTWSLGRVAMITVPQSVWLKRFARRAHEHQRHAPRRNWHVLRRSGARPHDQMALASLPYILAHICAHGRVCMCRVRPVFRFAKASHARGLRYFLNCGGERDRVRACDTPRDTLGARMSDSFERRERRIIVRSRGQSERYICVSRKPREEDLGAARLFFLIFILASFIRLLFFRISLCVYFSRTKFCFNKLCISSITVGARH